jgi:biopolymer transport protein ExbD
MRELLSAAQRGKIRRLSAPSASAEANEHATSELNVVPFLDIVMNVLMFVLATLAITFTSTIDATAPGRGPRPPTSPPLDFTVLVVGDGFGLKARGGNVAPGCSDTGVGLAVPNRERRHDYASLQACAAKLKASSPAFASERAVIVSASPEIPYDVLVATVDAVRTTPEGEELFPDVRFAVVR